MTLKCAVSGSLQWTLDSLQLKVLVDRPGPMRPAEICPIWSASYITIWGIKWANCAADFSSHTQEQIQIPPETHSFLVHPHNRPNKMIAIWIHYTGLFIFTWVIWSTSGCFNFTHLSLTCSGYVG